MAILTFQMGEVWVLPNRFIPSSKGTCILSLYIIMPNFIKIGWELFEIIDIKTHGHTDTQTDTYTRVKRIPVQKQSFWASGHSPNSCYLAQKHCFWIGIIFICVYVSVCVSVCLCVCLWVFTKIISKNSWPILMKLGMMMYNDNISIPFENGINRLSRTHTSAILNVKIAISYKMLGQTHLNFMK